MVKEQCSSTVARRIIEMLSQQILEELMTELQHNNEWLKICATFEVDVRPSWFTLGKDVMYGYEPKFLLYHTLQDLAASDLEGDAFFRNCNVYCAKRLVEGMREHCHNIFFVHDINECEIIARVMM